MRRNLFLLACAAALSRMAVGQASLRFRSSQIQADTGILQIATADFNGDGNADLIFLAPNNLSVLLGHGDGTFEQAIVTPAAGNFHFTVMVIADFNNDGKPDVAILGAAGSTDGIPFLYTYLGRGDGTFSSPLNSSATAIVGGVPQVADVNGDGNLDLIGATAIALGAGDGTFSQTIAPSPCMTPAALGVSGNASDAAVADFRNDGNLDLAMVATHISGGAFFQVELAGGVACFGNNAGAFSAGPRIFANSGLVLVDSAVSYFASAGDFNGDGNPDVLISSEYAPYQPPSVFSYSVIFGNGDGTFQTAETDGPMQSSVSTGNLYLLKPVVIDMNGDGKSDLVQIGGQGVEVFLSNGNGTFTNAAQITPAQNPASIAVADFNNDGLPDIVSTGTSQTTILINTSMLVSSVLNAATLTPGPIAPGSVAAIMGAGIGPATGVTNSNTPLPDSLAGVSVTFNGVPAPLSFVSSRQINAQVPWEISGNGTVSGNATVVVSVNGASAPAFQVATAPIAPGIFLAQPGQALAINSDGTIAGPTGTIDGIAAHPAVAGDTLTFYANGLGPVTPPIADGAASSDQLRYAGVTPVFIGNAACDVLFAGLSPTFVGVDQVNITVPAGVHGVVPLQINAGGIITSSQVTIAVQ